MDFLLYFVKYPQSGKVKTRLAESIGYDEAARIYRCLAESNFETLSEFLRPLNRVLCFDPPDAEESFRQWLQADDYLAQTGATLGDRLSNAVAWAFLKGAKRVLAVGSDTLNLKTSMIHNALESLEQKDVVLGPAKDGGYYLIGLSSNQPELFQNIPWSTSDVLETTLERAKQSQLSYSLIAELEDLDDIQSLKRFEENYDTKQRY